MTKVTFECFKSIKIKLIDDKEYRDNFYKNVFDTNYLKILLM